MLEEIPLSGLRANQRRMNTSAHNVANVSTDEFSRHRVSAQERPSGEVDTRSDVVELSEQGKEIARAVKGPQNNVDLASEAVEQIEAREAFKSNARTLRTQDRLMQSLLDIFV